MIEQLIEICGGDDEFAASWQPPSWNLRPGACGASRGLCAAEIPRSSRRSARVERDQPDDRGVQRLPRLARSLNTL